VLHAAHRLAYMGERLEYHLRRQRALELPDICCSMITDGMAMHHCNVPHIGNKKGEIVQNVIFYEFNKHSCDVVCIKLLRCALLSTFKAL